LGVITKVPELWTTMAGTVETDLQLVDILELADLADEINSDNVNMVILDDNYTIHHTTEQGAMVLLPLQEKIDAVVTTMFAEVEVEAQSQAEAIAVQAAAMAEAERQVQDQQLAELQSQLAAEGATVVIQNGTDVDGIDAETALFLKEQGFDVVQFGPADIQNYPHTVIVDYSGKEYTLGTLVNFFNVTPENVRRSGNSSSNVDIRVIIGTDFQPPNVRPKSSMVLQ